MRPLIGALGLSAMAYALLGAATDPDVKPIRHTGFLVTVLVLHDGVLLPAVIAVGVLVHRVVPAPYRAVVQAALVASAAVTLVALPLVLGYGRIADNPSALPRDYGRGLLTVLAAVWLAAAVALAVLSRRHGRRRGEPMPHAEHSVTVDRPIGDVFAYLADGTNNPCWRAGVLSIERTSAGDGAGATYRQKLRGPGGRAIDGDYRITAFDPPTLVEFEVTAGPARPTGRFALAEAGPGRTTVTFSLDLTPTGLMRLMSGMIGRTMRSEVGQLAQLKAELEKEN